MYRERITITISQDLLQAVDSQVDKQGRGNRSQVIEELLREGIGLHQLKQAFLFLEEQSGPLERLVQLIEAAGVQELFVCVKSGQQEQVAEVAALAPNLKVETVPAEFGSGGAVILQKERLETPFLLIWPSPVPLPASLTSAYLFHRSHHLPLTYLLQGLTFSGIAIASPELVTSIPAGITDLQVTTFPDSEKDGKVRAYLY